MTTETDKVGIIKPIIVLIGLNILKTKVDVLDVRKLKIVAIDLKKLINLLSKEYIKKVL